MKDFYDIWLMSRQFDFDGPLLARAVKATFDHRKTPIDPKPVALTPTFSESEAAVTLWKAFLRRGKFTNVPERFADVIVAVAAFFAPVAESCIAGGQDRLGHRVDAEIAGVVERRRGHLRPGQECHGKHAGGGCGLQAANHPG